MNNNSVLFTPTEKLKSEDFTAIVGSTSRDELAGEHGNDILKKEGKFSLRNFSRGSVVF